MLVGIFMEIIKKVEPKLKSVSPMKYYDTRCISDILYIFILKNFP